MKATWDFLNVNHVFANVIYWWPNFNYKGRHGFLLKCISTGKIVYRHYNDMKKTGTCHGKKSSAKRASTSIWSMRKSAQGLVKSKKPRQCRHHSDTIRRGEQPKTYPSRIRKPVQRLGFERAGEC